MHRASRSQHSELKTTLRGSKHCLVVARRERRHCPPTKWSQSQTKPHPIQKERVATQTPRTTKSAQEESCPEGNCSILPQGRNQVTSRPNRGGTGASLSGRRTTMPTLNEMYNPENWARATKLRGLSHQRGSICQGAKHARRVERPRLKSSAWDASNARFLS